jgi:molybdenum cofactor cytidylyltransferase
MIAAIVVAAGLSRRMGQFKLLLPWDGLTVIGQVVATLEAADLPQIVVVTGHRGEEVATALAGSSAQIVHNPDYAVGEMLSSIKVGLAALGPDVEAALLCLGDQPQMPLTAVVAVLETARDKDCRGNPCHGNPCREIIIPSYQMHAGHPILLPAWLWPAVLTADTDLRAVLRVYRDRTRYIDVDTLAILADLDTPKDYQCATTRA